MRDWDRRLLSALALAAVIAAYAALSVASSFATRLRFGPDEPAHFVYVREIGSQLRMPILAHTETPDISTHASHEAHQPPLCYLLAAVPYSIATAVGATTDTTWRILRLFTVLLGAGYVYFLYRLAREFIGRERRWAAVVAAASVGLLPSSVYIGGVVNNDTLTALIFTAALWAMLKAVRRGDVTRRAAVQIGLISGLAVLTKAQGLALLPTIAAAGLLIVRRKRWQNSTPTLVNTGIAVAVALLIGSPWFIRNWMDYGSPIIQSLYNPVSGWSFLDIALVTDQLFKFFWTPFWLVREFVDDVRYSRLLLAFCFVVFVGVVAYLRADRKSRTGDLAGRLDAWMLLALPAFLIYVSLVRHTLAVDRGALQQGRLLLPSAGLLGIAIVLGLGTGIRHPALRAVLGAALIAGIVAANLAVLHAIVAFYQIY